MPRSVEGATAATAVKVLIDTRSKLIIHSSAGHPPPILLRRDGTCELLDQATDPPLGAREHHVPRLQAGLLLTCWPTHFWTASTSLMAPPTTSLSPSSAYKSDRQ